MKIINEARNEHVIANCEQYKKEKTRAASENIGELAHPDYRI